MTNQEIIELLSEAMDREIGHEAAVRIRKVMNELQRRIEDGVALARELKDMETELYSFGPEHEDPENPESRMWCHVDPDVVIRTVKLLKTIREG